ncbi:hypothetical protein JHK82_021506 [Glycine max]|uniref:Uncharacterized protein n=1 Tax=Glycine max TaxID=3847 RepID=K7L721_SOYBN|nr:hypothetical protein JHK87_021426 [Glycine soja]KAG5015824.1 hypothetical protein JHK85_021960 [Glycine max]KAG5025608.1 hypothetical protein JHK86_021522 [Glycine max]KAG5136775.1 hypothetical protein JHK82_021506 [Glycine max]KAH1051489.1 hypothetical protein GYH30_021403 [Glycine max]
MQSVSSPTPTIDKANVIFYKAWTILTLQADFVKLSKALNSNSNKISEPSIHCWRTCITTPNP